MTCRGFLRACTVVLTSHNVVVGGIIIGGKSVSLVVVRVAGTPRLIRCAYFVLSHRLTESPKG